MAEICRLDLAKPWGPRGSWGNKKAPLWVPPPTTAPFHVVGFLIKPPWSPFCNSKMTTMDHVTL